MKNKKLAVRHLTDLSGGSKLLTIEDLRNPKRKSGFSRVKEGSQPGPNGGGRCRPSWRASFGLIDGKHAHGPRRATPEAAAQDACDHMNGAGVSPPVALKQVNHPARQKVEASQEVKEAWETIKAAREANAKKETGYVYVLAEEGSMFAVKVGHSRQPFARPGDFQMGNPRKLLVVGVLEGTEADERALHQKYISDNVQGEWFRPSAPLLSEFDVTYHQYRLAVMTGKGLTAP